jgi:guanine nucleotide-binding protein G(i) subunit alpha
VTWQGRGISADGSSFVQNLERITSQEYIPQDLDVVKAETKTTGISETQFAIDDLDIHLWNLGGARTERRKWIHCFNNMASVMVVVSLSEYDKTLSESSLETRLRESLVLFESVAKSRWFENVPIVLIFTQAALFRESLALRPLIDYFPDYDGGTSSEEAENYIVRRFTQLASADRDIYSHLVDTTDTSSFQPVLASIKEIMRQRNSRSEFP